MRALIIVAHGSRNKASAGEVAALASRIETRAGGFDRICHAFLQFSDPLLPAVLEEVAAAGADQVVVFPFFIATGSHVLTDIPEQVAAAAKQHPDVRFAITRHLGVIETVEDLILGEVEAHGKQE